MDVLNPDLIWIQNRCYRLNVIDPQFSDNSINVLEEQNNGVDLALCTGDEPCDFDNEDEFEVTSSGRVKMKFSVAKTFWAAIVGTKGSTKRRIENDLKVVINIPKQNQDGDIIITGNNKRDVALARRSIDAVIQNFRKKQHFTHFISIPMTSLEIQNNFMKFKEQVLSKHGKCRGIDETIFQDPRKLHLTIEVLVLMDTKEREKAKETLQDIRDKIITPLISSYKTLSIKVEGVEYMNDDPSEIDVLYGKVGMSDGSLLLQDIADTLAHRFAETGFVSKDNSGVKLHVTLMNTLFREDAFSEENEETESASQLGSKSRKKERITFDGSFIVKEFSNFYFGVQEFDSLHLSMRHTTAPGSGYYQASCVVKL